MRTMHDVSRIDASQKIRDMLFISLLILSAVNEVLCSV